MRCASAKKARSLAALLAILAVLIVAGCGREEQSRGATPNAAPAVEANNAAEKPQVAPN